MSTAHPAVVDLVEARGPFDPATAERLRARLIAEAEEQHLLDVAYRIVESPVGPLLLAATTEGLLRVAFDCEDHDAVLGVLARRVSPRILWAPARLDEAARQLDAYFACSRRSFDLPVDLRLAAGFHRTVLGCLPGIAYGTTQTYSTIAATAGSPAAVRAVGSACANNPVPLVVPCHRVVRSDGTIGQYRGGTEAKQALLDLEAS